MGLKDGIVNTGSESRQTRLSDETGVERGSLNVSRRYRRGDIQMLQRRQILQLEPGFQLCFCFGQSTKLTSSLQLIGIGIVTTAVLLNP